MVGFRQRGGFVLEASGAASATPQYSDALFYASLNGTVVPEVGSATYSFSRAATAFVLNDEGMYELANSGELRFPGFRRVENFISTKSEDFSNAAWTKVATCTVTGTNTLNFPAVADEIKQSPTSSKLISVGSVIVFFVTLSGSGTTTLKLTTSGGVAETATKVITLTSTPTVYAVTMTIANASHTSVTCSILRDTGNTASTVTANYAQICQVTSRVNQQPPEYVSVGVKSTPFHGCFVDGVKYFATENGSYYNTTSGVVARGTGKPLAYSKKRGMLLEPARQNYVANSSDGTFAAFTKGDVTPTASSTTAPDGSTNGSLITVDATAANHRLISPAYTITAGAYITSVAHVKAGTAPYLIFSAKKDGSNYGYMCLDTTTWRITERGTVGTARIVTANVEPLGYAGWVKLSITTYIDGSNTSGQFQIATSNTSAPGGAQISYTGAGETFYLWNPEVVITATPNAPVITTGSAASNTVDAFAYNSINGVTIGNCTLSLTAHARGLLGINSAGNYSWIRLGPTANDAVSLYAGGYTDALYAPGAVVLKVWNGGVGTQGAMALINANTAFTNYAASFGSGVMRGAFNGNALKSVSPYVLEDSTALPSGTANFVVGVNVSHCIKDLAIFNGIMSIKDLMRVSVPQTELAVFLDGDSLTAVNESSLSGVYNTEQQLERELWREMGYQDSLSTCNLAVPASRMYESATHSNLSIQDKRTAYTIPVLQACNSRLKVYCIQIGTNDYGTSHLYTDVIDHLVTHITALKAAVPGLKVVVITNTAANSSDRTTFCNNLRTEINSRFAAGTLGADAIADFGGDSNFNDYADTAVTTYYRTDRTHYTHRGHMTEAQLYLAPAINSLL